MRAPPPVDERQHRPDHAHGVEGAQPGDAQDDVCELIGRADSYGRDDGFIDCDEAW